MDSGHVEAAGRLIDDLNRLRREVGNPSLGRLAQLSGGQFSKTTLDDHLARRRVRLPQWHLVAAFVTACHHAAASTGLDVERLGTLKDWHRRYLAALEGNADAQCPIDRRVTNGRGGTRARQDPEACAQLTMHLTQSAVPLIRGKSSKDLNQAAPGESGQVPSDRRVPDKPAIHNSDDELEVSAQGAGTWMVRWLSPKPSPGEPKPDVSQLGPTESLSSSQDASPEDQADLTLSLAIGTALLLVKRGPFTGSQFVIDQDRTTIGRDPASDVFLDDATVSRAHSVIYRRDGYFSVRDVGSLNGTYVDRRRIAEGLLVSGNELQVGVFRFLYLQSY